jgi:hypothetical protein
MVTSNSKSASEMPESREEIHQNPTRQLKDQKTPLVIADKSQ